MTENKLITIYISKRCGRLANRLIIFANVLAYSEEHRLRLRNYTFHTYCKEFETTRNNFHCQYPRPEKLAWQNKLNWVGNIFIKIRLYYRAVDLLRRLPALLPGITLKETADVQHLDTMVSEQQLQAHKNIFIHSWTFRCPDLVKKHELIIRNFFRPAAQHRSKAEAVYNSLKANSDIVIGIHIRQGDYKKWKNGKFYFSTKEYVGFMKSCAGLFAGKQVSFIICSNEDQDEDIFTGLRIVFGPGTPVADLYTLSLCDYILGPVSTFSQWASFYGQTPMYHMKKTKRDIKISDFAISDLGLLEH